MRTAFAWMVAGLVALSVPGGARASEDVTTFQLDNGMDVVVIEDHRAPVVTQMVWYRVGAADEPRGRSGVAHFLEHLMFKGTDSLDPGEFSSVVARNGGSDNAFTSQDQTAYFQRIAADRLDIVMEMEADRMANLRLATPDLRTEREVILEERNQRVENSPSALIRERKSAAQYLNHPYGVPVIGWRGEIADLDRAAARAFYDTFYAPNNAILVVAGDVTPDSVRKLARAQYGAVPANPDLPARTRPQEPPQLAERRVTLRDARVSQPYLGRSYLAPARVSGDQQQAAALYLLAQLLGGGQTSVLTQSLQIDDKIAVQTGAWYSGTSLDETTFELVVVPAADVTLDEAETALDAVLAEFVETGPDAEQLARLKMQLRAEEVYDRDDAAGRARRYGRALTSGLTVADVQAWPDILQDITAERIVQAARQVLDDASSVTARLLAPEETE